MIFSTLYERDMLLPCNTYPLKKMGQTDIKLSEDMANLGKYTFRKHQ